MSGGIFLVQGDRLVEMFEEGYASEDLLQALIARYPSILAGDLEGERRRWLLVQREAKLASEEEGAGRWSVDHLFLDQDAVPTLVEVKRSSDTRIRREVVGQMLDYAANAVVYWPANTLRGMFEAAEDADARLSDVLDPDEDVDAYWAQVDANLTAGRIRLVFVSDSIPSELRRIVEFLNGQMNSAEVLAIEIKQYLGEGLQTLVPRVVGQTAQAQSRKRRSDVHPWDEQSFLAEIERVRGSDEAEIARQIVEWSRTHLPRFTFGKSSTASFSPALDLNGHSYWPFYMYADGKCGVEFQLQWMKLRPPFEEIAKREEFLNRLNQIPGVSIPASAVDRRPSVPLVVFAREESLEGLLSALDWFVAQAHGAAGNETR